MKRNAIVLLFFLLSSVVKAQNINTIANLIAAERYDEAMDSLSVLKNTDPDNPYVYFSLGETVLKSYISDPFSDTKSNAIKKSRGYFDEGIKKDSINPLNYVGFGILELFQKGDTAKANQYFNKSLNLIPVKKKKITDLHVKTYLKLATTELYSPKPRFFKAEGFINKLKEINPNLPDIYIVYGDLFMTARADASGAIANYKKALYLEDKPLTNVLIAKIYALARNLNESKKYYDNALQLDSLFAPAYKGLGDLYYLSGQNKTANSYYAKFLRLTGNNIPAKVDYAKALYKAKDNEEALKVTKEVLKVDSSKLYLYRIAAYSAFDKKPRGLNDANMYIEKLFKKAKKDEFITKDYIYYGKILLELKRDSNDVRRGINMLETAFKEDSTDSKLLQDIIGNAYINKDYNTAIRYFIIKMQRGEPSSTDYLQLGRMYYMNKDYEKAYSILESATVKDTMNIEAYLWRGYSASVMDQDMETGKAKPYFERIMELGSSDKGRYSKELTEACSYLGSYYLFSGNPDLVKATNYYNQLIAMNSQNNEWLLKGYYSLAIISSKQKDYGKSKVYYQKVLSIKPDDKDAQDGLRAVNKYLNAAK